MRGHEVVNENTMELFYRDILASRDVDLGIVTMNRPERRNALSEAHMLELTQALRSFGEREDVRAVILAAAGSVYCAGHDFADMVERELGARGSAQGDARVSRAAAGRSGSPLTDPSGSRG